jgi:hypothetical protein
MVKVYLKIRVCLVKKPEVVDSVWSLKMMLINFDLEDQPQRRELSASSMVGSRMLSCIPSPFDPWGSEYQQNFSVSYIKISCQGLVLAGLFFYNGMKSCQQMLDFFYAYRLFCFSKHVSTQRPRDSCLFSHFYGKKKKICHGTLLFNMREKLNPERNVTEIMLDSNKAGIE